MLDTWERRSTDEVIERLERAGGEPRAKARRAGALTFSDELLQIDLAATSSPLMTGRAAVRRCWS
jgi:hypothetical protein